MVMPWMAESETLHKTPRPVIQVQCQGDLRHEVDDGYPRHLKAIHDIRVHIDGVVSARNGRSERKVSDVVDNV